MIDRTGFWEPNFAIEHHVHSQKLSDWILNFLKNHKTEKLYDFGCGMGTYLNDLHNNGYDNIIGIEMMPPKTDYSFRIVSQNLTEDFLLGAKGNVISLEVGEHIPKEYQDIYLDNITNHCSRYLIISWALRGQGGFGHFNELNNDEVIPEIEKRGFTYLVNESLDARSNIEDSFWYFRNSLMVFKKN